MSDPEQRIDELFQRYSDLRDACLFRSAHRISREVKQIAKTERLVIPYLYANHQLMNNAQSLMEPKFGAEVAIESIALLESEERARQIQADLPEGHYEYVIHSMSSCAYDNLAKHIAQRDGYNSDGVHDCIADGIQVCRRTGKLECISCFREYATDVYVASDDLEMAHHHAMAVMQNGIKEGEEDSDRRWVGAKDLISISLLQGQLEASLEHCSRAIELAKTYHTPNEAIIDSINLLEQALLLAGRHDELDDWLKRHEVSKDVIPPTPKGEHPTGDISNAQRDAIALCCKGDYAPAIELLTEYDQLATKQLCLDEWFSLRIQLVATYLLAGDRSRAERLAKQLEHKAKPARDWLSLRRIKALFNGDVIVSPLGQPVSFKEGPFGEKTQLAAVAVPTGEIPTTNAESASDEQVESETVEESELSPEAQAVRTALTTLLDSSLENFVEHRSDTAKSVEIVRRLFELNIENFVDASDASRVLHLANMLAGSAELSKEAWSWCQPFFEHFANDAVFVNVYANIAFAAREEEQLADREPDALIPFEKVEDLFQRSLDLDPERVNNFARAGQFYLSANRTGDAERCFARGFRLSRDDDHIALQLAEIYAETDRVSDALNVLDMNIRSGGEEPVVYWQAAMLALRLERFQIVSSCLEKFDEIAPGEQWTHYYLAVSYVEQKRPEDALKSLQIEQDIGADTPFGIEVLRAAAFSQQGDNAAVAKHLDLALSISLSSIDYLTRSGIANMLDRMLKVAAKLGTDSDHYRRVSMWVVQAGLAPDELFEVKRLNGQTIEGVGFYMCTFEQPLDSDWAQHPGCVYGETTWASYISRWGVIARSEEEAEALARAWQEQCYHKQANLLSVDMDDDGYEEQVGVVWQSAHIHPHDLVDEDEAQDSFDEPFDEGSSDF